MFSPPLGLDNVSTRKHPMTHLPDPITQSGFYENVSGKRLLAWVFDAAFILVLCLLVLPFTGFLGIFFLPFLWLVVGFAYRTITIANGSATWGMRIASIELRNSEGARLDLSEAALHTLGYTISFGFFFVQAVSIVLMCASMRGQSLTDHVLGTVMLNKQARR
jgi:uncharacterized RDD family membrane protein YckC